MRGWGIECMHLDDAEHAPLVLLNNVHPFLLSIPLQTVVHLSAQYRMAKPIMDVANSLFYDGALVCGSERVAQNRIQIPEPAHLAGLAPWIQTVRRVGVVVSWF